jgi:hypothetical protein
MKCATILAEHDAKLEVDGACAIEKRGYPFREHRTTKVLELSFRRPDL